jgi:membrane protein implicated in regulation of membrane protease activity
MANVSSVLDALDATGTGNYVRALAAIAASLTLTQWSVVAGIVTALISCVANVFFMARKDRREERALRAQLEAKTVIGTKKNRLKSGSF